MQLHQMKDVMPTLPDPQEGGHGQLCWSLLLYIFFKISNFVL